MEGGGGGAGRGRGEEAGTIPLNIGPLSPALVTSHLIYHQTRHVVIYFPYQNSVQLSHYPPSHSLLARLTRSRVVVTRLAYPVIKTC